MQSQIYNVTYKGFSVGMTFNKQEALSWVSGSDYKVTCRNYSVQ